MTEREDVSPSVQKIKCINRNGNNVYVFLAMSMMVREDADLSAQTIKFTNLNGSNVFV